jgi:hypothetical protein
LAEVRHPAVADPVGQAQAGSGLGVALAAWAEAEHVGRLDAGVVVDDRVLAGGAAWQQEIAGHGCSEQHQQYAHGAVEEWGRRFLMGRRFLLAGRLVIEEVHRQTLPTRMAAAMEIAALPQS